jgi:hypothetical protein
LDNTATHENTKIGQLLQSAQSQVRTIAPAFTFTCPTRRTLTNLDAAEVPNKDPDANRNSSPSQHVSNSDAIEVSNKIMHCAYMSTLYACSHTGSSISLQKPMKIVAVSRLQMGTVFFLVHLL